MRKISARFALVLLCFGGCKAIEVTPDEPVAVPWKEAEAVLAEEQEDDFTGAYAGREAKALLLSVDQTFLPYALTHQNVLAMGELALEQTLTIDDPGVPCIESLTISGLRVIGFAPEHVTFTFAPNQGRLLVTVAPPSGQDLRVRGRITWQNGCTLDDVGKVLGDAVDTAAVVDQVLAAVLGGAAPSITGVAQDVLGLIDIFADIFGVDLAAPSLAALNIFDPAQFGSLDQVFGVSEDSLTQLAASLGKMTLEHFLGHDLFHLDTDFEIVLEKLQVVVPLAPGVRQEADTGLLELTVPAEDLSFSFSPAIAKFGKLPASVLQVILELIFPQELIDSMVQRFEQPAAELLSAYLRKALADQLGYLRGDLSAHHFDTLFDAAESLGAGLIQGPSIDRAGLTYRFDFTTAEVRQQSLFFTLGGLIASQTIAPCLQDEPRFADVSALNLPLPDLEPGTSQLELALSSNVVNQALYALTRAGLFCRTMDLDAEGLVVLGDQMLGLLVEDLPKVGTLFPPEVRRITLAALLEDLGILALVREKPIRVEVVPAKAPRLDFTSGTLALSSFWFEVSVLFGDVEMLHLSPRFEADLLVGLDASSHVTMHVADLQVSGEVILFPSYEQQRASVPLDLMARKMVADDYDELLAEVAERALAASFGEGLPLYPLELFGLRLAVDGLEVDRGHARLVLSGR